MELKQALIGMPPDIWEDKGDEPKDKFQKRDAVVMKSHLTLVTTHTKEICIVVKICNGEITIKDSGGILYLVFARDIVYIGHLTECIPTVDGEILFNL